MSNIISKMATFNVLKRNIVLGRIAMTGDDNLTNLHIILKYSDEKIKKDFYKGMIKAKIEWIEEQIKKIEIVDEERINAAKEKIASILENLEKENIDEQIKDVEENTQKAIKKVKEYRNIMKSGSPALKYIIADQRRGIEIPPIEKDYDKHSVLIDLPKPDKTVLKKANILDCINDRESKRKYTKENLTLEELSYLLWSTQGVRKVFFDGKATRRTVPSGGSRHPFETYLAINYVENLEKGVYRYLSLEHKLIYLFPVENMIEKLNKATLDQVFVGNSAVCFIWTVIPYRCEWRYTLEAKKIILQDSGHLCQNLYLACESILCGTCAIGAYNQELMDNFLKLDGEDEFVIYLSPVGKIE